MISVVIPAFNSAAWLPEALASVRAQTLAADEVIVVDNNSTDESAEIAARHGATVLHESMQGAAAARNRGIRAARGDWIALLDADDYWLPEKLARQWSLAEQVPGLRLLTTNYFFDNDGKQEGSAFAKMGDAYTALPKQRITPDAVRIAISDVSAQLARGNAWLGLNSSAVFFKKEDALALDGFDPTFARLEDMEFFARLLGKVESLAIIETPVVAYRWHSENSSHSRLQMAACHIRLRESILADPARYVISADVWARATLPRWYRQLALAELRGHRAGAARNALEQSWKLHPNWRTALLWMGSHFVR